MDYRKPWNKRKKSTFCAHFLALFSGYFTHIFYQIFCPFWLLMYILIFFQIQINFKFSNLRKFGKEKRSCINSYPTSTIFMVKYLVNFKQEYLQLALENVKNNWMATMNIVFLMLIKTQSVLNCCRFWYAIVIY